MKQSLKLKKVRQPKSNKRHIIVCPACKGKLTQKNRQGLKVICPACRGKGEVAIPDLAPEACQETINPFSPPMWDNAGGLIC